MVLNGIGARCLQILVVPSISILNPGIRIFSGVPILKTGKQIQFLKRMIEKNGKGINPYSCLKGDQSGESGIYSDGVFCDLGLVQGCVARRFLMVARLFTVGFK